MSRETYLKPLANVVKERTFKLTDTHQLQQSTNENNYTFTGGKRRIQEPGSIKQTTRSTSPERRFQIGKEREQSIVKGREREYQDFDSFHIRRMPDNGKKDTVRFRGMYKEDMIAKKRQKEQEETSVKRKQYLSNIVNDSYKQCDKDNELYNRIIEKTPHQMAPRREFKDQDYVNKPQEPIHTTIKDSSILYKRRNQEFKLYKIP